MVVVDERRAVKGDAEGKRGGRGKGRGVAGERIQHVCQESIPESMLLFHGLRVTNCCANKITTLTVTDD